jgi:hypothetical protein
VSAHADLAAILLDEPVGDRLTHARVANAEAQQGESLIMAGYAYEGRIGFGGIYGLRYSRKNPVTRAVENGRGLYRQQGPYLWDGYAGGPCFREDSTGSWLVGIASKGAGEELTFTSTWFFRDWLEAELQNAAKAGASSTAVHGKD